MPRCVPIFASVEHWCTKSSYNQQLSGLGIINFGGLGGFASHFVVWFELKALVRKLWFRASFHQLVEQSTYALRYGDVSIFHQKPVLVTLFPRPKISRCGRWNRYCWNNIDRLWHARIRADHSSCFVQFWQHILFFQLHVVHGNLVCCVPCYRTDLLMKTPPMFGTRLPPANKAAYSSSSMYLGWRISMFLCLPLLGSKPCFLLSFPMDGLKHVKTEQFSDWRSLESTRAKTYQVQKIGVLLNLVLGWNLQQYGKVLLRSVHGNYSVYIYIYMYSHINIEYTVHQ